MTRGKWIFVALFGAGLLASGGARAELIDRGGGLLYDSVLNVTWLQDASYARTSGYDADGRMTWDEANAWAANLVYHDSVRNYDYTDWRLPTIGPVNGVSWNYAISNDGSTDHTFNNTSPRAELAYMYYVNLGLKGAHSPSGTAQADFGIFRDGTQGGQADVGLVRNLQSDGYWYGTSFEPNPTTWAWFADYWGAGYQQALPVETRMQGWAVRAGDVVVPVPPGGDYAPPIPEPETHAMLLCGLGLLAVMRARRRR